MDHIIAYYFSWIYFCFIVACYPAFHQCKRKFIIDAKYFRVIKVKRLRFMFRPYGYDSMDKDGIILPMFIMQIIGPVLALLFVLMGVVLIILDVFVANPIIFVIIILFILEILVLFGIELVLQSVTTKRTILDKGIQKKELHSMRKEEAKVLKDIVKKSKKTNKRK